MARILLTGGSSFTGLWIGEALAAAGHEVVAALRGPAGGYRGLRDERIVRLGRSVELVFDAPFASPRFIELAGSGFDLLAHHAADIPNYRSPDYDVMEAVNRNLLAAEVVLTALASSGARALIATGTTFEAREGRPGANDLAVSPYGLSKTLTNEALRHFAHWRGLSFGKFVIAAPFGPLEEGRFAWSLFQSWTAGQPGKVRTPRYIRDNIPSPLLGQAYVALANEMLGGGPNAEYAARPSGFVGAQASFAQLLAEEMRPRLGLACEIELLPQPELSEPEVRANTEPWLGRDWPASAFWDDYAAYYARLAREGTLSSPA